MNIRFIPLYVYDDVPVLSLVPDYLCAAVGTTLMLSGGHCHFRTKFPCMAGYTIIVSGNDYAGQIFCLAALFINALHKRFAIHVNQGFAREACGMVPYGDNAENFHRTCIQKGNKNKFSINTNKNFLKIKNRRF
jgi:hypothetical protein